ncbi:MAG: DUF3467 domain-containing protein [Patescibacteria group bacterium]|nr:DUF3467 domain-containing protein [Patescibacteria group bacterium]
MAENKIKIVVPDQQRVGKYSNAVSVSVTQNDVVIDMGYIVPGQESTVEVVSRINMSHGTAESFLKVLQDTLLDYRAKAKGGRK